jgi:DNA-binding NarL/FixJ family response regulator
MSKPRVLLADDHRIVAVGLEALLATDYEVVGWAPDGRTLLDLVRATKADFIVADISMPGVNGIRALEQMRRDGLDVPVIFLTMHAEPVYARLALEAGAAGYVLKDAAPRELLNALQVAAQGGIYVSTEMVEAVFEAPSTTRPKRDPATGLTARQREILRLQAAGHSAKQVARMLGISQRTVEYHKYQLMAVLGVKTSAELVQLAERLHLLGP